MMIKIVKKRKDKWRGSLKPNIWKIIEKNGTIASKCEVAFNGDVSYEIQLGEDRFKVNLAESTCSCKKYNLFGVSCAHAICAIEDLMENVEDFVSSWYHKDVYMVAYDNAQQLVLGMKDWLKSQIDNLL